MIDHVRMHYFCERHRAKHDPALTMTDKAIPKGRHCCFCRALATCRGFSAKAEKKCPPGHIPKRRLGVIARRALRAAVKDW